MSRYILFDFDGTLVDSKEVVLEIYNDLAKKQGLKTMKGEDIETFRGLSFKVPIIWVEWGLDIKQNVLPQNPDYIATKPEEILDIIRIAFS